MLGTPGYIAPELWSGQPPDARADLYALGATLFELLTGRMPFASSDPYGLARLQQEPLRIEGLRESDARLLRRALDPDPEQRFLDAAQMLRALSGETVPRAPATPPPLSAGEYDVLVHDVLHPFQLAHPPIARVLDRLGAEPCARWRLRLLGAGQAVLVSGASRGTAEAAAQLCAEHGLPATVRPISLRPRSEEWLARHGAWALALLFAAAAGLLAGLLELHLSCVAAGAAAGYLLSWGLRPPASAAPLSGLPGHGSSLERLADGIARRAQRLRGGGNELSADLQDLVRASDDATGLARDLVAAEATDGARQSIDLLTSRLLHLASALDDALAER